MHIILLSFVGVFLFLLGLGIYELFIWARSAHGRGRASAYKFLGGGNVLYWYILFSNLVVYLILSDVPQLAY